VLAWAAPRSSTWHPRATASSSLRGAFDGEGMAQAENVNIEDRPKVVLDDLAVPST
jgi:hypothetical protein